MQINKLELKNISYYKQGSEETPCYNAVVYVNGKKAMHVDNNGRGGCDRQSVEYPTFDHSLIKELDEYCVKTFGVRKYDWGQIDIDLEHWCHDRLYEYLDQKKLKKDMVNMFICVDKSKKELYGYKKKSFLDLANFGDFMKKNHPNDECLNNMDFKDAWKLFDEVTS